MTQVLANAVIYASQIAVIALGVSLAYSILRFANFAHVQLAVVGAYASWLFATALGLPFALAIVLSLALTGALAVAVDRLAFRRLRTSSAETKMIASWGMALLMRSLLGATFGGSARFFDVQARPLRVGGALLTSLDGAVVGVTVSAMMVLHLLLRRTRMGTALRALASNADLAETRGIPGERMIALMWFLSGAYAALGGTLLAAQTDLRPNLDLVILLPVFAAATVGGLGSVFGAVGGAFVLSFAQHALIAVDFGGLLSSGSWHVPTQFRDYLAVAALVIVLLVRPQGLAGRAR